MADSRPTPAANVVGQIGAPNPFLPRRIVNALPEIGASCVLMRAYSAVILTQPRLTVALSNLTADLPDVAAIQTRCKRTAKLFLDETEGRLRKALTSTVSYCTTFDAYAGTALDLLAEIAHDPSSDNARLARRDLVKTMTEIQHEAGQLADAYRASSRELEALKQSLDQHAADYRSAVQAMTAKLNPTGGDPNQDAEDQIKALDAELNDKAYEIILENVLGIGLSSSSLAIGSGFGTAGAIVLTIGVAALNPAVAGAGVALLAFGAPLAGAGIAGVATSGGLAIKSTAQHQAMMDELTELYRDIAQSSVDLAMFRALSQQVDDLHHAISSNLDQTLHLEAQWGNFVEAISTMVEDLREMSPTDPSFLTLESQLRIAITEWKGVEKTAQKAIAAITSPLPRPVKVEPETAPTV